MLTLSDGRCTVWGRGRWTPTDQLDEDPMSTTDTPTATTPRQRFDQIKSLLQSEHPPGANGARIMLDALSEEKDPATANEMLDYLLSRTGDLPVWNPFMRVLSRATLDSKGAARLLRACLERGADDASKDVRLVDLLDVTAAAWWRNISASPQALVQLVELHAAIGGKPLSDLGFADLRERARRHGRLNALASSFVDAYAARWPEKLKIISIDLSRLYVRVGIDMGKEGAEILGEYEARATIIMSEIKPNEEVRLSIVGSTDGGFSDPFVLATNG